MIESRSSVRIQVPGRINLIGDHTDYTGGLVLPTTVDMFTTMLGNHTDENVWRLTSQTHGRALIPLDLDDVRSVEPQWARYPAGVLLALRSRGIRLRGFEGSVSTTLPVGAGLSSSAALEIATARVALDGSGDAQRDPPSFSEVDLAQICQHAEHIATGVPCGIMDQLSIVAGCAGSATLIDCSSLEVTHIPIPDQVRVEHSFITQRSLIGSEYAQRVAQCRKIEDTIGPLCSASMSDVERLESELLQRRARHVISENLRVRQFVDALSHGEYEHAGRLMVESHQSLAVDYQVSNQVMDDAVNSKLRETGVLGARMTGGGFGGCIVVLRRR